jgi:hypothetical protein
MQNGVEKGPGLDLLGPAEDTKLIKKGNRTKKVKKLLIKGVVLGMSEAGCFVSEINL